MSALNKHSNTCMAKDVSVLVSGQMAVQGGLNEHCPLVFRRLVPQKQDCLHQRLQQAGKHLRFLDSCRTSSIMFQPCRSIAMETSTEKGQTEVSRSGTRESVPGRLAKCQAGERERVIDMEARQYKWKVLLIRNALNIKSARVTCL